MLNTLREFLDEHRIRYLVTSHSTAYTAQEIAQTAHVNGREFAKTVIVKLDGELVMTVIPAPEKLDLDLLAGAGHAKTGELAGENEFQGRFPKCEIGAMPPFGNLFGMDVYLEEDMTAHDSMSFNAGSHTELIQLKVKDYTRLVAPNIARICKTYTA